jgi:lysophospholipid acyltransferase (LPLAT)-like uncharacterized protein
VAVYGVLVAATLEASFRVMGAVARFEVEGREAREAAGAAIEACWHQDVWAFLMGLSPERPWVSFMHPVASLAPFATFMRWRGGRVVLGSAGNDGRAAAEEVCRLLREGFSLIVFPDGPAGPARKVKPGLLQLARESGRPIVPVRFEFSRPFAVPSWDAKRMPWPGSVVRKRYGAPIFVGDDLEAAAVEVEAALGQRG